MGLGWIKAAAAMHGLAKGCAWPAATGDGLASAYPVFRSEWVAVHVAMLLAADAALAFSLLASALYFLQERRLKRKVAPGFFSWLPPLETMDRIARAALVFGFLCMTGGLLAGSFIAQQRVGARYFEDTKVLLSFGLWLVYLFVLLLRQVRGIRGRRAMFASAMAFLLVLSVWAANLVSSVHRYAAP